jgi:hypothetical protein
MNSGRLQLCLGVLGGSDKGKTVVKSGTHLRFFAAEASDNLGSPTHGRQKKARPAGTFLLMNDYGQCRWNN